MKKRVIIIGSIILSVLILLGAAYLLYFTDKYTLSLPNKGTITIEYGVDKNVTKQKALYQDRIFCRKGISLPVTVKGDWNPKELGTYKVTFETSFLGKNLSQKGSIKVLDTLPPEITLVADSAYVEEGFSAKDLYDGDITDKVVREERDGKVYYTVTDSNGNTATKERKIIYKDFDGPLITLTGGQNYKHQLGTAFKEPGFTAIDDADGDVTANVTSEGTVDGMKAGTYTMKYQVKDSAGNISRIARTVTVTDLQGPVITLAGTKDLYIKVGTPYAEAGFTATDNLDGTITEKVMVSGSVDTSKMGYNTLTYTVSDSHGHTTTVTRSVFVYEKQAVSAAENPGDKVIYLTFDDGPSKHTAGLLNTLDKYGIKATFFVTNQFPAYQNMIGETYRRGHTIALHTYSHRYTEVYASETAYYGDLAKIDAIVKAQCPGFTPTIVRFPGGTNNTVSRNYTRGIMTALSRSLAYHGYLYCDGNVSSGDAGGAKTVDAVYQNVINGIQSNTKRGKNVSVVLQHDITSFSTAAVDKIIFWGLSNGYTFLPMSEKTPMVHFNPLN